MGDLWVDVRSGDHLLAELVAVADGAEVVGHVGISHCWIDARRELVSACMLSPLSTVPGRQRAGIGTSLVAAALEAARALDRPALFLEGSPSFYSAAGVPGLALRARGMDDGSRGLPEVWWRHDSTGLLDPRLADIEAALGMW